MSKLEPKSRIMNACPTCGGVMDVTACAPYSKVVCPSCSTPIRVRTEFDHFTLQKQIGEGGMSRVFLALDQALNRQAALKILNPGFAKEKERVEQFEREARITAAISHPNVVKVFSVGQDQSHFFIAMELVPFGSLDEKISKEGQVSEMAVLDMAEQLALGLQAAHEAGLIHRDMKPGNILFSQDGTAKIVDFGLAMVIDQEDENTEIWATPYYVPPEKLHKKPEDFRSDIYSLGASLFHALAGKPPYEADTASLEELKVMKDKQVHLELSAPHASKDTCNLIDKMMARKPADRHKSYKELLEHIRFTRQSCHEPIDPVIAARRNQKVARENLMRTLLIAGAAVIVLTLGLVFAGKMFKKPTQGGGSVVGGGIKPPGFATNKGTSQKFISAREAMFAGDFAKASKVFEELSRSGDAKQPTLNWARFNAGLCGLFQERPEVTKHEFGLIAETGEYETETEEDAKLAEFFVSVAEAMNHPLPVPLDRRSEFSESGTDSLALLAFGLKDWEAGYFSEAKGFLEAFAEAQPDPTKEWVNDYKGLLEDYVHDMKLVTDFPSVRREPTLTEARGAIEKANAVLKKVRSSKGVKQRLIERTKRMEKLLARLERADEVSEQARLTALRATEKENLKTLKASLGAFSAGYKFPDAIEKLEDESFFHPDINQEHEDELYIWMGAEEFLNTLVEDIEAFGYDGAIPRVEGTVLSGKVTAASRDSISVMIEALGGGQATIPLSQIPPRKLLEIATGYVNAKKFQYMPDYLRRRELIILFARQTGLTSEAETLAIKLTDDWAEFGDRWYRIERNAQTL